ncbi:MAG TPA: V-type ATP synthase subunit I [Candidatus Limnocylindrales bacterium]|nr:V-type ATP synthase subunit I [Candidatus Limnocylindrales bacterium]
MAVAKMKKVYIIGHQTEKDCTLGLLQRMAVMEITDLQGKAAAAAAWAESLDYDGEQESLYELEGRLNEMRFALDFLGRHFPEKKGFLSSLEDNRKPLGLGEFNSQAEGWEQEAQVVYKELRRIDEKLMSLRNDETRLQNIRTMLQPWNGLAAPLQEIRTTTQVCLELGILSIEEGDSFRAALASAAPESFLEEAYADRTELYLMIAYAASSSETVKEALKPFSFNRQDFNSLQGTPAENLVRIEDELKCIAEQRQALLDEVKIQVVSRSLLNQYSDYLVMERDKKQLLSNLARTSNAFVIEGWVREKELPDLEQKLAVNCNTVLSIAREPEGEEQFPVALENPPFAAPFEFITSLYGTPHHRGLDPTFALTPFFVAFFGICMSDAGYGVIITVLGALMLWKANLGQNARRVFRIVVACGVSTIIFGALIGGWFGGLIPIRPLFFDAMADPMRMLIYALAIGIFQIFVGMGLMFYRNAREGKWMDAVSDQLFWALFLAGLIMLAFPQLSAVARVLAYGAAAGLLLTQGRGQKGIFKKFGAGLFALYNTTGYLGDILSYSRLLALGLATSVIATSINMLALMLGGSPIGIVLMVIMLIGGHIFNLVINILGAYVHSSRLQYLEFFNRFFEGGGRPFKPFKMNTNYVHVTLE